MWLRSWGYFVHTFGDAHIYLNHLEQVETQLSREPRTFPTLKLNPSVKSVFDFTMDDIKIEGYEPSSSYKSTNCCLIFMFDFIIPRVNLSWAYFLKGVVIVIDFIYRSNG